MMRFCALCVCVVATVGCGGDDEKIPARIDAATIDARVIDGPTIDAPTDAPTDAPVDAPPFVNNCLPSLATDATGAGASRTITFSGLTYTPTCLRIAAGQMVTFSGDFTTHPLVGGTLVNGTVGTPDATSPITTTNTGTTATFTFPTAGEYPFYCTVHQLQMMGGVVYVQ